MWLLVPLFVLWSNLHGEFVIGLGVHGGDPDRGARR